MAQFDSFAPFSHTIASDVAQETPRYDLSFEEEILQYSQSRQLRQSQQPRTEQLVKVTGPIYDISSRAATTTECTPTTHPLPTLATTPSLVSALRSTIQPPTATRSRIVVIPGAPKTGALQQDVTK